LVHAVAFFTLITLKKGMKQAR